MPLRSVEARKHLVSDQLAGRDSLHSIDRVQISIAKRVSLEQFIDCAGHSCVHVPAGRTAVRNDVAYDSTPANSTGWRCCTDTLDRTTPQHLRAHQPAARRAC